MTTNRNREKAKEQIQKWLLEEGFKVKLISDKNAYFNFVVEDKEGRFTNVYQTIGKPDQIKIATRGILTKTQETKLMGLSGEERNMLLWNFRMGLINRGVGFSSIEIPLKKIKIETIIYYDGLTKDNFMYRLFEVRKTLVFMSWIIDRALGEPRPTIQLLSI